MLVYPFTFYAVYGAVKIRKSINNVEINFARLFSNKKVTFMFMLPLCLGLIYLLTPVTMTYANKSVPNMTGTQTYFSTDPSVPYQDVDDIVQAMNWINVNSATNSCVLLQHHYFEYGHLYLNNSIPIVHYQSDVDLALNEALEKGFTQVYLVWWNTPINWNENSAPSYFIRSHDFQRISIFSYQEV